MTAPHALRFAPRWQTLLSAAAIAAAWPPWDVPLLAWVALVPWLGAVARAPTAGRALLQGLWLGLAVGLLAAPWLAVALREFLGVPWAVAVLGLLVFAAVAAQPHLLAFAPLVRALAGSGRAAPRRVGAFALQAAGLALAYAGLDWAVPRLFDVGLGYALHDAPQLRQLADLGGVPLLTALLVWGNVGVWQIVELARSRRPGARVLLLRAAVVALPVLLAAGYGELRLRQVQAAVAGAERVVRAGVVQGNVANDVRLAWAAGDDRAAEKQLATYMLLTEELFEGAPGPDLVVWPEATFPGVFRQPATKLQQGRANKFDRQVLRLRVPILFGAYDMEQDDDVRTLFNALFSITPRYERPGSLGTVHRYRKHRLLPLAETLPGLGDAAFLRRVLPTLGFFGRGSGPAVFPVVLPDGRALRVAPIICSESLLPGPSVAGARRQSQVILNIGSDGWFGSFGEPQFHLAVARLRSVETRRPQIRAANTGISALILPDGAIAQRSALGRAEALVFDVPVTALPPSPLVRWGGGFGPAALVLGLAWAMLGSRLGRGPG